MEWYSLNQKLKEVVRKTEALSAFEDQVKKMAKELSDALLFDQSKFEIEISKVVWPVVQAKIKAIQDELLTTISNR